MAEAEVLKTVRKPLFLLADSWYTINEVSGVQFKPFVFDRMNRQVPVFIEPMLPSDAEATNLPPVWQTPWTSKYLAEERFEKYAAKLNGELIALAAYEVLQNSLVVHIVYIEAHPESNPTLDGGTPQCTGIGRLMIAYEIKMTIDNGFAGDVALEAKTTSLARHYEKDFGAIRLPVLGSSAPQFLIADEAAKRIFFTYHA